MGCDCSTMTPDAILWHLSAKLLLRQMPILVFDLSFVSLLSMTNIVMRNVEKWSKRITVLQTFRTNKRSILPFFFHFGKHTQHFTISFENYDDLQNLANVFVS